MAFETASTMVLSSGNWPNDFFATTTPSTAISKMPFEPLMSSAFRSNSDSSAAAARAALGAYPQAVQYVMVIFFMRGFVADAR